MMNDNQIIEKIIQLMKEKPLAYFSMIFSDKHPELKEFVLKHSAFLDGKLDSKYNKPYKKSTRIIYAINGLIDYPKCKTCGNPIMRNIGCHEDITNMFCCNRCAQKDPDCIAKGKATKLKNHGDPNYNNMDKNRKTCKERYGVEYSFQSDRVKEASKKTLIERFGVDHQMRSDKVKNEMRQRYRKKHGVDYSFQDPEVKVKINNTNKKNFGVDWPMQNKELHALMHRNSVITQKTNYYNDILAKNEYVEPLFDVTEWIDHSTEIGYDFKWRCKKCGNEILSPPMHYPDRPIRCFTCYPANNVTSMLEIEIVDFIKSLSNEFEVVHRKQENRSFVPNREIDIVVKKNGKILLLIEVDGLYWHSMLCGKDKNYHLNKTEHCIRQGHQLIHIFEDEWTYHEDIVKSRLKNLLGIYDAVVFARKCSVVKLTSAEAKLFFNETHIQGNTQSAIRYGLKYENEIVAAMSFGHRRKITNGKRADGEYELLRFSTKLGHHVVGAASRLLSHFERDYNPKKLLSYADKRWSIGKLYEALGFVLDHESSPNYWYMTSRCDRRLYRYGFRKSKLPMLLKSFDANKTELENMLDNGYNVIWDCGNYVFVKSY